MTNLPNRTLAKDRLAQSLSLARRNGSMAAVLFLDLDNFKTVNDSLGHSAGDQLLCVLADRLVAALPPSPVAPPVLPAEAVAPPLLVLPPEPVLIP